MDGLAVPVELGPVALLVLNLTVMVLQLIRRAGGSA